MDFKNLKSREKVMMTALIGLISIFFLFKVVHSPTARKIQVAKAQIKKLEPRIRQLQSQFPQLETQEETIRGLTERYFSLTEQMETLEQRLPSRADVSQILSEIARSSEKNKLNSIKQKVEAGKAYDVLFTEVSFNAPYEDVVRTLSKIESISSFLQIDELEITKPKGKFTKGGRPVRIVVSTPLGHTRSIHEFKAKETDEEMVVERDVFVSSARPTASLKEDDYKLEGITYQPDHATAIINGDVVGLDALVGSLRVKSIFSDTVVLTDGIEEYALSL